MQVEVYTKFEQVFVVLLEVEGQHILDSYAERDNSFSIGREWHNVSLFFLFDAFAENNANAVHAWRKHAAANKFMCQKITEFTRANPSLAVTLLPRETYGVSFSVGQVTSMEPDKIGAECFDLSNFKAEEGTGNSGCCGLLPRLMRVVAATERERHVFFIEARCLSDDECSHGFATLKSEVLQLASRKRGCGRSCVFTYKEVDESLSEECKGRLASKKRSAWMKQLCNQNPFSIRSKKRSRGVIRVAQMVLTPIFPAGDFCHYDRVASVNGLKTIGNLLEDKCALPARAPFHGRAWITEMHSSWIDKTRPALAEHLFPAKMKNVFNECVKFGGYEPWATEEDIKIDDVIKAACKLRVALIHALAVHNAHYNEVHSYFNTAHKRAKI
jgi:hypothetical protein